MYSIASVGVSLEQPQIPHPWVFFRLADGLGTGTDEIVSEAYGPGAVTLGAPLTFADTLGAAWTTDTHWLTLDGSVGNCFAVAMADIDSSWIVKPNGGLLVWGQINSNFAGGSNASPMIVGFGNSNPVAAHAFIRYGADRAGTRDRVQTLAVGSTSVATLNASGTPLSNNVTHLLAYYIDMASGNLRTYVDGALRIDASSQVDADDFLAAVSSTDNVAGQKNWLTIGGGIPSGGTPTYSAATQWEGKLRRVGIMSFEEGPNNLDSLMLALAARGGIPGREFVF